MKIHAAVPPRSARALLALLVLAALPACERPLPNPEVLGAYRFDDGRLASVRRSAGRSLRVRFYDSGVSRRLHPAGALRYRAGTDFSSAEPVEATVEFGRDAGGMIERLEWSPVGAPAAEARRVNRSQRLRFGSDGASLAARLDLPDAGAGPLRGAVALVHGSGSDSATEFFHAGDFLAAHGIATLTYDKRGTGDSEGRFTFDFERLARDAVAAVAYLEARPELAGLPIGLCGYSQGGWTAPLAASLDRTIRFVVVSYGLVASPAEEARVETRHLMRARGVAEEHLDDLDRLTNASVDLLASGFEDGWEELRALRLELRRAPWTRQLHGTTVGKFLRFPELLIRWLGPRLAPRGLPWHYDSMAVLERLDTPMVWLLAGRDTSAPIELALPMLELLRERGHPIEIRVFPEAEHGMLRLPEGFAPGYFPAEVEAALELAAAAAGDRRAKLGSPP